MTTTAAYVVYSVNTEEDAMDDRCEDDAVDKYDDDSDGLNHYYGTVSTTASCKQYFTADHKPLGPVVYKYPGREASIRRSPSEIRAFLYRESRT